MSLIINLIIVQSTKLLKGRITQLLTKKTGEIIFKQNRTCELPQFLHDVDDYAIM